MKLGISYPVFHGEELLEYAIKPIRNQVDFVCTVYQNISFNGNPARPELLKTLIDLGDRGLVDQIIVYQPDLSMNYKQNEVEVRNLGLDCCRDAGCTHHISADVDEFYKVDELEFAKNSMEGYDCSMAGMEMYYKQPTWKVTPKTRAVVSLIHSVNLRFDIQAKFPVGIDESRKLNTLHCRAFRTEEITVHHMSYVRKDIRAKLSNTTHDYKDRDKFIDQFNKYQLGDRFQLAPDFLIRKTLLVENTFNIPEVQYDCHISNR
jgi:hypothetical protein